MAFIEDRWLNRQRKRTDRYGTGLRWRVEWEDAQGHKRRKSFEHKALAEDWLTELRHEQKRGVYRGPESRLDVTGLMELYIAARDMKPTTEAATRRRIGNMVLPTLGQRPIGTVTRRDVQDLINRLRLTYAPRTIRTLYGDLATLYKWAVAEGHITVTPCTRITLPEVPRELVRPLRVEQVRALADAVSAQYKAAVLFDAATGLRGGELRGLTWDRVDTRRQVIIVDRQLAQGDPPVFSAPKTAASVRVVQLGPVTLGNLLAHRKEYGEGAERLVFHTQGSGWNRSTFAAVWRRARDQDPTLGAGWHQLRHFHASQLIAAGLSPVAVAHRLGHKDATETLATYSHLWDDDDQRMARVGDSLTPRTPPEQQRARVITGM